MEQTRRHSENITLIAGQEFFYGEVSACTKAIIIALAEDIAPAGLHIQGSIDGSHFEYIPGFVGVAPSVGVPLEIPDAGCYSVLRVSCSVGSFTFVLASYWN
jgi:hypothetical protein